MAGRDKLAFTSSVLCSVDQRFERLRAKNHSRRREIKKAFVQPNTGKRRPRQVVFALSVFCQLYATGREPCWQCNQTRLLPGESVVICASVRSTLLLGSITAMSTTIAAIPETAGLAV